MTIQEFIEWVQGVPFYKGWNLHYNYDMPSSGNCSHSFLATNGDKTHRYRRTSLESLVSGIKETLAQIEREAQNAS